MRVEVDPPDPDDPTKMSGRLIFDEPMPNFIGCAAGELRAIGLDVPEEIPDCAKCEQAPDGGWAFSWIKMHIVLGKDGAAPVVEEGT